MAVCFFKYLEPVTLTIDRKSKKYNNTSRNDRGDSHLSSFFWIPKNPFSSCKNKEMRREEKQVVFLGNKMKNDKFITSYESLKRNFLSQNYLQSLPQSSACGSTEVSCLTWGGGRAFNWMSHPFQCKLEADNINKYKRHNTVADKRKHVPVNVLSCWHNWDELRLSISSRQAC